MWSDLPATAIVEIGRHLHQPRSFRLACRRFSDALPVPPQVYTSISGVAKCPLPISAHYTLRRLDVHLAPAPNDFFSCHTQSLKPEQLTDVLRSILQPGFVKCIHECTFSFWLEDFAVTERAVFDALVDVGLAGLRCACRCSVEVNAGWMSLDGSLAGMLHSASRVAELTNGARHDALVQIELTSKAATSRLLNADRFPVLHSLRIQALSMPAEPGQREPGQREPGWPEPRSVMHVAKLVISVGQNVRACSGDVQHLTEMLCGRYCGGAGTRHVCISVPWDGDVIRNIRWTHAATTWSFLAKETVVTPMFRRATLLAVRQ